MTTIFKELKEHMPFTWFGTLTGIVLVALVVLLKVPHHVSELAFNFLHPAHVFFSAFVTASIYYIHSSSKRWVPTLLVGYFGAIGIGTISDCIIPYLGELLLNMPHAHHHIGFIELWWVVNPLALLGAISGILFSISKEPHAIHVLLSTWASLFHITMAMGTDLNAVELVLISVFLFLAVWLPCCVSDIVFPLLFIKKK